MYDKRQGGCPPVIHHFKHHVMYDVRMLKCNLVCTIIRFADCTVMFEDPVYRVDENDGPAQPVLILSNPANNTFTVQVFDTDGSATGEY